MICNLYQHRLRVILRKCCLLLIAGLLLGCAGPQRNLPVDYSRTLPWGAHEINNTPPTEGFTQRIQAHQEESPGEPFPYQALLISGGGIRGNYGAGVLNGWNSTGQRPEFDLVTGVSVGALMATHVFLGHEYDEQLRRDASNAVEILASRKARASIFKTGSTYVGRSFMELLEQSITEEVVDAVAREYQRGRRLFIGTVNLDGKRFIIWDMGLIASSERPDRLEHFRKVLLASASVPILFPPVMFEVDTPQGPYEQMHVDGGLIHNVFFAEHADMWLETFANLGIDREDVSFELFVLHNGRLFDDPSPPAVEKQSFAIMGRSLQTVMEKNAANGIYELWLTSMVGGGTFNLAYIQPDVELISTLSDVDARETANLYALGFVQGRDGTAWIRQAAPNTQEELRGLMEPGPLQTSFERHFLERDRAAE